MAAMEKWEWQLYAEGTSASHHQLHLAPPPGRLFHLMPRPHQLRPSPNGHLLQEMATVLQLSGLVFWSALSRPSQVAWHFRNLHLNSTPTGAGHGGDKGIPAFSLKILCPAWAWHRVSPQWVFREASAAT